MKQILLIGLLGVLSVSNSYAIDLDGLKPLRVITGMKTEKINGESRDAYEYEIVLLGEGVIRRGNGVCDFINNRIVGQEPLVLKLSNGEKMELKKPIIKKEVKTEMCQTLPILRP